MEQEARKQLAVVLLKDWNIDMNYRDLIDIPEISFVSARGALSYSAHRPPHAQRATLQTPSNRKTGSAL